MNEQLYQIIYISTAEPSLTEDALMELLAGTQKRNAERGITGLLLHSDGNIIQILEGTEYNTQNLYKKIAKDTRHRGVSLISSRKIEQRDFPHFKMGFKRASKEQFKEHLPHFSRIVEGEGMSPEELVGYSKLVATFLKTFARTTQIDRFGKAS